MSRREAKKGKCHDTLFGGYIVGPSTRDLSLL